MYRPILGGAEQLASPAEPAWPATLEEAEALLAATAEEYAAALEQAGSELDRAEPMPFGGTFHAARAVCFPVMDLFHHHGQIWYLQSLLGDTQMHWDEAAIDAEFAWKGEPPG